MLEAAVARDRFILSPRRVTGILHELDRCTRDELLSLVPGIVLRLLRSGLLSRELVAPYTAGALSPEAGVNVIAKVVDGAFHAFDALDHYKRVIEGLQEICDASEERHWPFVKERKNRDRMFQALSKQLAEQPKLKWTKRYRLMTKAYPEEMKGISTEKVLREIHRRWKKDREQKLLATVSQAEEPIRHHLAS